MRQMEVNRSLVYWLIKSHPKLCHPCEGGDLENPQHPRLLYSQE